MRKISVPFILLFILFAFTSCTGKAEYADYNYYAMNSPLNIRLSCKGEGKDTLGAISARCFKIVSEIEKDLSATAEDSFTFRFNSSTRGIAIGNGPFCDVISDSLSICDFTDGAFDPTVYPIVKLWDISNGGRVPTSEEINEALTHVGYEKLSLEEGFLSKSDGKTELDLGGIGKGYAVEKVTDYLKESGISYGLCSFKSTVGVFGHKPDNTDFTVTVCDPRDTSSNVLSVSLSDGFISSSGDYERFFEFDGVKYHHIFDRNTGYPAKSDIRSVTVLSDKGSYSDALSTALFTMGMDKSMEFYRKNAVSFEAIFITDDGIYITDGLKSSGAVTVLSDKYKILS